MNELDTVLTAARGRMGFLTKDELATLATFDRLRPVLVRCGNTRFTAGAQYVAGLIAAIEAAGDYVRDVCLPTSDADPGL